MSVFTGLFRGGLLGSALLAASAAGAAIIPVSPGINTLQTAITTAADGDVLELVSGTYAGVVNMFGKNLTIRAVPGSTPLVPDNVQVSSAHRLVLQGLSFSEDVVVSTGNAGATLVVLQSTFKDAVVQCNGVKCIIVGNRFDPQSNLGSSWEFNAIGGSNTVESVFAGNEMQSRAFSTISGNAYFSFHGGSSHIVGNRFLLDSVDDYHQNSGRSQLRVESGVVAILGNRFEMLLDTAHSTNNVYTTSTVGIGNATVLIRNNAFTLVSASGISQDTTGYRVSALHAINVMPNGGEVQILNNVFDYRDTSFGASVNPAQGAILAQRHVQKIEGNVFLGIKHGAVELGSGAFANVANNLCHQIGSTCPGAAAISANPLFADSTVGDYHLQPGSPAIDAGPGSPYLVDIDGTRNDMGAHGGPFDLDQFDVQRGPGTLPFVYPLFDANRAIDGNGNLQIRLIGVGRNQ